MATDSERVSATSPWLVATDRISGLPDNQLTDLSLSTAQEHAAVDAALAAYSAPTVRCREIKMPPAGSSWLDFALQASSGSTCPIPNTYGCTKATDEAKAEDIVLPLCERICASLVPAAPAGVFSALAALSIKKRFCGWPGTGGHPVLHCSCSKQLVLYCITLQDGAHVPSICCLSGAARDHQSFPGLSSDCNPGAPNILYNLCVRLSHCCTKILRGRLEFQHFIRLRPKRPSFYRVRAPPSAAGDRSKLRGVAADAAF